MRAEVFISHSSKDQTIARTICTALEKRGLSCWIASRDVTPGENFQEAIVLAIRSAKIMVLVFTDNANNSGEIKKELALASRYGLLVIPARVEDVVPSPAFELEFATRQWIDLFEDWEQQIDRLTSHIAAAISIKPSIVPVADAVANAAPQAAANLTAPRSPRGPPGDDIAATRLGSGDPVPTANEEASRPSMTPPRSTAEAPQSLQAAAAPSAGKPKRLGYAGYVMFGILGAFIGSILARGIPGATIYNYLISAAAGAVALALIGGVVMNAMIAARRS